MSADWLGILEDGRNIPSLTTIFRLAKAFDVEASELVRLVEAVKRSDDGV